MRLVKIFVVVFVLNMTLAVMVYIFLPEYRNFLVAEDSFIENASAFLFLFTSLVAIKFAIAIPERKPLFLFISAFGLLAFLDEISFGKRIIDYGSPKVKGKTIDSCHDFVDVAILSLPDITSSVLLTIMFSAVLFLALYIILKYRNAIISLFNKYKKHPSFLMLMFFILLVTAATLFDLQLISTNQFNLVVLEELFELNAGFAFLFLCLTIKYHK